MAVTVRAVDLDAVWEELLTVRGRNLTDLPHFRRFKWMYRDYPLGPAWSWFAFEREAGRVPGVASGFRRARWLGSRVGLCGQDCRSLGPALMFLFGGARPDRTWWATDQQRIAPEHGSTRRSGGTSVSRTSWRET
jgi:hypothetical protein